MKLRIEISPEESEEIVIRCHERTESVKKLESVIENLINADAECVLYIGETEYFVPYKKILFFEACEGKIYAHTKDKMIQARTTLAKLEELLPSYFVRCSKSCIINALQVGAIAHNITGPSKVYFNGAQKVVYASRSYYKYLKDKILTLRGV
ncbi:MAG: LytTR family transcriptional regulator [Clostridiales bacterium]|nr:LytTR family transcriptional regulator [Clostridiales bacterium]